MGQYFCQGDLGSSKLLVMQINSKQLSSFKDTLLIMIFFYCDHLCNCAFKKKSYIFSPFNIRKKIMKLRGDCFDDNIEIVIDFDREMAFFPMMYFIFLVLFLFSLYNVGNVLLLYDR